MFFVILGSIVGAIVIAGAIFTVSVGCGSFVDKTTQTGRKVAGWLVCAFMMFIAIRLQINYLQPSILQHNAEVPYLVTNALLLALGMFLVVFLSAFDNYSDNRLWLLFSPGIVAYGYLPAMALWDHVLTKIHWI